MKRTSLPLLGRREFVSLLGGAPAAWPLAARAQPDRMRRLGVLMSLPEDDPESRTRMTALRQGLQQLGWTEGRNLRIDHRSSSDPGGRERYAAELVRLKPDAIFAGTTSSLVPLQRQTRTIPIVFAQVSDPVGTGFVASLARPGGNITGFAVFEQTIAVKWLELLKQLAPHVTRALAIYDPANPSTAGYLAAIEAGASLIAVPMTSIAVRDAGEIERAIDAFASESNGGLIVLPAPITSAQRELIIALANRRRLPAIYPYRFFVTSGGLASYGADNHDTYRRAASYIDRILKGEKPGELPVQQASKFELVINLKTAKALALDPPISLLARTDEVIE